MYIQITSLLFGGKLDSGHCDVLLSVDEREKLHIFDDVHFHVPRLPKTIHLDKRIIFLTVNFSVLCVTMYFSIKKVKLSLCLTN
jgi:hypothetical protein